MMFNSFTSYYFCISVLTQNMNMSKCANQLRRFPIPSNAQHWLVELRCARVTRAAYLRTFGRGSSDQSWCWNLVRLPPRKKAGPINEPTIVNPSLTSSNLEQAHTGHLNKHQGSNTRGRESWKPPKLGGNPTLSDVGGVQVTKVINVVLLSALPKLTHVFCHWISLQIFFLSSHQL